MVLDVNVYLSTGATVCVKMAKEDFDEGTTLFGHPDRVMKGDGYCFDCRHLIGLVILEFERPHGC